MTKNSFTSHTMAPLRSDLWHRGLHQHSPREFHLQKLLEKLFLLPEPPQLDRWVSHEFSKNKNFGSQDRKWYAEKIFYIVRNLYCILYQAKYKDEDIENFSTEISNPETFWKVVQELWLQSPELITEYSKSHSDNPLPPTDNRQPLTANGQLPTDNRHPITDDTIQFAMLQASVPFWLHSHLQKRFPNASELKSFLCIQNTRPLLWIRLNHPEKQLEVIEDLNTNEFEVRTYENKNTLSVVGTKSVYNLNSFKNGLFEIQDYASQEIGNALNIKPGNYVWDACAGGGGKTIQIASALQNKGVVYATDIREYKLEEIKRRAKRAQFFNVRTLGWDGKKPPSFPKEIQNKKGFDSVLVDAPCSASGTWRRHPDAKYKVDHQDINELSKLQFDILSAVHIALKEGGKLVYATCSVFIEENEEVVHKFLEQNSNFKLVKMTTLGSPAFNSDSMFVAVMKKNDLDSAVKMQNDE